MVLRIHSWLTLFIIFSCFSVAQAQAVNVTPLPDWVKSAPTATDQTVPKDELANGEYYRLVDKQVKVVDQAHYYSHFQIELTNQEGVENSSQITINFDPSYETVQLHQLQVIRDNQILDQLKTADIKVIQRETDLEHLIYDGSKTITIVLSDVRVGDKIDYSYSIIGDNPAFKGKFSYITKLKWSVPVGTHFFRLLWPQQRPLFINQFKTDLTPELIQKGQTTEYQITQHNIPVLLQDEDTPKWFSPYPQLYFSEFKNWQQVVNWAIPHYAIKQAKHLEIQTIAQKIKQKHTDPADQVIAALAFVQDEIRYLGIEAGIGSHVPSLPTTTLSRRFGDCKDKTMLLLAILQALSISGYPALVSTDDQHQLAKIPAYPTAFNHVIAYVELNNQHYWLDPTLSFQAGDLQHRYQPNYGFALLVKPAESGLTSMKNPTYRYLRQISDELDLTGEVDKPAIYNIKLAYQYQAADRMRSYLARNGLKYFRKSFLNYLNRYYPNIETLEPLTVSEDKINNHFILEGSYHIPGMWKKNEKKQKYTLDINNWGIYKLLDQPDQTNRTMPFVLEHPAEIQHQTLVKLDEDWSLENEQITITNPFFKYSGNTNFDNTHHILTLDHQFSLLQDNVTADEINRYVKDIKKVDDNLDYSIWQQYGEPKPSAVQTSDNNNQLFYQWNFRTIIMVSSILLLVIAGFILILSLFVKFDYLNRQEENKQSGYPLSITKFFLLSAFSFNLYHFYWFYRQWYSQHNISSKKALWLSVCYPISFFWLIRKVHKTNKQPLSIVALAIASSIFLVLAVVMWSPTSPYWLALLACLPLVWLQSKINRLTTNSNALQANSQWSYSHGILVLFFIAVFTINVGTTTYFFPNDQVIKGNELWTDDYQFLRRAGALASNEQLLFFYSDGFASIQEQGSGITSKKVISYWRDELSNQLFVEVAKFNEIKAIDIEDTSDNYAEIVITRHDGSEFVFYIDQTNQDNKLFSTQLMEYWNTARKEQTS
ncbi:DUF3857 domain-containing protein [Spartinivicinus ruber]|uniref:DUF3857 domain-containing protein n=1 Tax=Spartinivicinus ruber TaxID=2683272 RepID=UPI0013D84EB9|nr:DUF3857 and transglutaminase domain-containing protein [Spartinivicinus ruber]